MKRSVLVTIALAGLVCAALALAAGPVALTTADGVQIKGQYQDAPGQTGPGLICLHMLGQRRQDWSRFMAAAAARGMHSIAIDLRGHGQSTTGSGGKKLDYRQFGEQEFRAAVADVQAAYDYLIAQPGVDKQRIAVVGASIGANLALNFAATRPNDVKSVVLLSPGKNYRGVDTTAAVLKFRGPLLFYAAPGDEYSYASTQALAQAAGKRAWRREFPGRVHGTRAFEQDEKYIGEILTWLEENL